ncbi:hypothetical protein E4T80_08985 [Muribacter muris]|uniref:Uncharacterized protein n=1 Tax=Muribacter muris TaxID=67855 RepID=A0A4Y9JXC5_9PAST|nr:hypothetical protein [Muribacter muris]MBF0785594.1 hypothetical protein [Muribacter muris]MBF0828010.1 hypothetical protein [Muribacter muris]TFV09086.1 hypothetical protein E4T80_08985 [Muribacter muris]
MADLEWHMQQPHFLSTVKAFEDLLSQPLEVNIVNALSEAFVNLTVNVTACQKPPDLFRRFCF